MPNPPKVKAKLVQDNARNYRDAVAGTVSAARLAFNTSEPGANGITSTKQMHNDIHAPLIAAATTAATADDAYRELSARVPLGESWPGQQVLDQEMKRLTHTIRMAAFNTAVTFAREIHTNTGFQRADRDAHNLVRQILKQPGDIDSTQPGILISTLNPMPTQRGTAAVSELCTSLTETQTRYPGTDLILRYAIKEHF
ncbi:putative transposase [Cryobacterium sp. M91]|uniref:putative transposase n=1 Tax=Cryobacterium sp. M91 TaxID=2048294 RepID=UPI0011B0A733|nr:hypothetical protein [Cryobacterium sp. M91]